uniref:hypothetical protein n=1 Tax=Cupriavidus yeoncheonensis TaxID=1462994 RepID=UPI003F49397A
MSAAIVRRQLEALGILCHSAIDEPGVNGIIVLTDWLHISVFSDGWMRLAHRRGDGAFRFAPATRSVGVLAWQIRVALRERRRG